jgi:hypothetical protein
MSTYSDLFIDQDASFSVSIDLTNNTNQGVDLSGYLAFSAIRKSYTSSTVTDSFVLNLNDEFDTLTASLSPSQTANLKAGRYVFDIFIKKGTSRIRVLEGQLHVSPSVTKQIDDSP